ncbi:MAG TPA: SBBP repeat-containing protein [Terriglobia bacterium]|nr:SBBP repeat-containing protein [Terriglobia bacterium]
MLLGRWVFLLALMGIVLPLSAQTPKADVVKSPLVFEPNVGQVAPAVRFWSRSNGHSFFLKDTEAVLSFANPAVSVRMRLIGQNPDAVLEGEELQSGFTNYFRGNDPSRWLRGISHFAKVRQSGVYPGIDLVYYGNERQLEYDFEVHPRRDPSTIQIAFQGVDKIAVSPEGDLILTTPAGEIRHRRPVAFQRLGNTETPVEASFVLHGDRVGFQVGRYDPSLPLTIDPKLVWSSYLGGTGNDSGNDVAVDADGNAYITGFTSTVVADPGPTTPPALETPVASGFEAFMTKIDAAGALAYTTYFGGIFDDEGHSLALTADGSVFVVGYSTSPDFPIVNGFQANRNGIQDAVVVKLAISNGEIQFSTYLGGVNSDRAFGVAVDASGNAYVAGGTLGSFPIVNAFQPAFGRGLRDGFLTKITPSGTIGFSTFFGGSGDEQIYDVAIDGDGNIIVTGYTSSQNFPVANALYRIFRGGTDDVFISKFNSAGSGLIFSTYLGGFASDNGVRLAVDKDNNIYVTGYTLSPDFPIKNAPQPLHAGVYDAFLIKLHPDGQDADFSTPIGGEDTDGGTAVAVDKDGYIYLAGFTNSVGFYAINAIGGFLRGARDGFVVKMAPDASVLVYSTYLGDFGVESATSLALDGAGNAYVTGFTTSSAFPVAENAFQTTLAGGQDGFIVKINADDVKTSEPYSFPVNGGAVTATAGQTSQPLFGYMAADVKTGLSPSGLEIIDLRSAGTLINEVSVPVPALTYTARFYVSTSVASATAVTIVNPNDSEATIGFYFTAAGGGTSNFGEFRLRPHQQTSGFLYTAPFFLPVDLKGTITMQSDSPVSAIALLVSGSGSSPTNVWIPIMNPYLVNNHAVVIPQFVDGFGWSTHIHLVNQSEDLITGEIRLFKNGQPGEPGVPMEIASEQGVGSVFAYSIEPRSVFSFIGRGEAGETTAGFAEIVPTPGENAPLAHAILNFSHIGFLSTAVEGVEPGLSFKMYVEISGAYPEALAATPALALANSSDAPATVNLQLVGLDGTDSGLSGALTIPPKGHVSTFLFQVPGFETLPSSPYNGVLRLTTAQPGVTFAGFRARYNEQGQFLATITGPLKEVDNMNPVIFPHLVDGGGYATQFIVIPGASGSGASGTIRYVDPSGKPLNLAIAPK